MRSMELPTDRGDDEGGLVPRVAPLLDLQQGPRQHQGYTSSVPPSPGWEQGWTSSGYLVFGPKYILRQRMLSCVSERYRPGDGGALEARRASRRGARPI